MANETPQTEEQATTPNVTVEDAGPARKKLSIEIPESLITGRLSENFDRLHQEAVIPGFRPGKAPRRLLEKRFGNDVRSHVRDELIGEAYQHAVESNNIHVLGEPELPEREQLELPESGPLQFDVTVDIAPEFQLPDLSGFTVTKPVAEIADEQVEQELSQLQQMHGTTEEAEDAVQAGDILSGRVEIRSAEGQVLHEAENTPLSVPQESADDSTTILDTPISGVRAAVAGKQAGEAVQFEAHVPDDHNDERLAGHDVAIHYRIDYVYRQRPLTTEELVQQAGLDSAESLRDYMRQEIQRRQDSQTQQVLHGQLVDQLLEHVDFEVPESLLSQQAEQIVQQRMQESEEEPSQESLEKMRSDAREDAHQRLKRHFLLGRLANELGADVSEHEVNRQIMQLAIQTGQRPERLRQELAQAGQLDHLYEELRQERAIDAALNQVQVQEVSQAEWNASGGSAGGNETSGTTGEEGGEQSSG